MMSRTIKPSSVKNISRFPSIKTQDPEGTLVESILESEYCYHIEFNKKIRNYFAQPETFFFDINGKQKKYTPDFLTYDKTGHYTYIEVKPSKETKKKDYQELFSAFESFITKKNVSFKVVDEIEIQQKPLLTNYRILFQYLKCIPDNKHFRDCAKLVKTKRSLKETIQILEGVASKRDIFSWLAHEMLVFNWSSERLSNQTEVFFDV